MPSGTKDFLESSPLSTDYHRGGAKKKRQPEEDYLSLTLNEINLELDNNSILFCYIAVN